MNSNSLAYEVSNKDIQNKVHEPVQIITYSQLENCTNILQYLKSPNSCLVMLIQTGTGGHWTCLRRTNDTLTYFDSYGKKPDGELVLINSNVRVKLHEDCHYLTQLLNKAKKQGFRINYNKTDFQQYANGINTCGKWVIAFCNSNNLDIQQYVNAMKQKKKETGLSYDEIVNELYQHF